MSGDLERTWGVKFSGFVTNWHWINCKNLFYLCRSPSLVNWLKISFFKTKFTAWAVGRLYKSFLRQELHLVFQQLSLIGGSRFRRTLISILFQCWAVPQVFVLAAVLNPDDSGNVSEVSCFWWFKSSVALIHMKSLNKNRWQKMEEKASLWFFMTFQISLRA